MNFEVEKLLACSPDQGRKLLSGRTAAELFPDSNAPEAALAGLWLHFSCFDEAHSIAQDIHTPEGSYWHAILHRQEPDPANAAYWFGRVGQHPVFPLVKEAAAKLGFAWDPFTFIDYYEIARKKPGSEEERIAREIERVEWQALFDYCARPRS
jgi:hypothetical protein